MPKYSLEPDYDYDFSLLAISSAEPDYKLCIHINRLLNIDLSRDIPIELSGKSMLSPLAFSCFMYEEEEEENRYILLSNRSTNKVAAVSKPSGPSLFDEELSSDMKGFLVPELLQTDYLLLIRADDHISIANEIQTKLKKLNFVQAIQNINIETLASKKHLII